MILNNLPHAPETRAFYFARNGSPAPAVILAHGFTSTPYSMRELGDALYQDGFTVKGILLPGHGTNPQDLEKTTWRDWYECVREAYRDLTGTAEKIFFCGQSLGALLGFYLSSEVSLNGLISISAGLKFKSHGQSLIRWAWPFRRFIFKKTGPDIKDPDAKEKEIHYRHMPTKSIYEIQKLMKTLGKKLPEIQAPVLMFHAVDDHTFDISECDKIYRRIKSAVKKKIILHNSYHVATLDYDKATIREECARFLRDL